ncbi:transcriptional regulator [Amycolatopsis sp. A1MSW2902]|uniref:winged helix-turn-helix transcriptional regulator n=1 Tax=Amycolatopsis sp. A1MSW2902 TaxID=687413 RepID=UPI00307E80C6
MAAALGKDSKCSIARSVEVLGDSWTLLIIREAMVTDTTRFQDFRDRLGVAGNILAKRLAFLVDEGVFERRTYQKAGTRTREEYLLTEAGRSLSVVIAALAEWGRARRPREDGTSPNFFDRKTDTRAQLAFVASDGSRIPPEQLIARRTRDS